MIFLAATIIEAAIVRALNFNLLP